MTDYAVRVEKLSKRYYIGAAQRQAGEYRTLRDVLINGVKAPFERAGRLLRGDLSAAAVQDDELWALRDVSFDVKQGEVIGIIGANGAGKSTLLKVLSRITIPTHGQAVINGRLGSLLEVGTGFHPELTGRENIYLNGAILGMRRAEIANKYDEIVAFSGVEQFLNTPVKRYSSGMMVRLAFAVAAHLEPEILVIDEVLSVGDAAFQKKSMGKMGEVAQSGRTVLFVSHNMAAVENLCTRGIVLERGQVVFDGDQSEAVGFYIRQMKNSDEHISLSARTDRKGNGLVRVTSIDCRDEHGVTVTNIRSGGSLSLHMAFTSAAEVQADDLAHVGITAYTLLGVPVFTQTTRIMLMEFTDLPTQGVFVCHIPVLPLPPSVYPVSITVKLNNTLADQIQHATQVSVIEGDYFGTGKIPTAAEGNCLVRAEWKLERD